MHRHWSDSKVSLIVPKNGWHRRPQNIFCVFEITHHTLENLVTLTQKFYQKGMSIQDHLG